MTIFFLKTKTNLLHINLTMTSLGGCQGHDDIFQIANWMVLEPRAKQYLCSISCKQRPSIIFHNKKHLQYQLRALHSSVIKQWTTCNILTNTAKDKLLWSTPKTRAVNLLLPPGWSKQPRLEYQEVCASLHFWDFSLVPSSDSPFAVLSV